MTETAPQALAPAPPPPPIPAPRSDGGEKLGLLGEAVAQRIRVLQREYGNDSPQAVQALARLRRGIGRQANDLPDLWGLVGMEQFYAAQPAGRRLDEEEALRAERAAHVAMTLWALHQQSNRTKRMHVTGGSSLGTAVRRLMPVGESDEGEPIRKRLLRAGTATTFDVLAQRLRELVVLLRTAEVPLDYGLLAQHLHEWQQPGGPSLVRQAWGRSFHAAVHRAPADSAGQQQSGTGGTPERPQNDADENQTKDQT